MDPSSSSPSSVSCWSSNQLWSVSSRSCILILLSELRDEVCIWVFEIYGVCWLDLVYSRNAFVWEDVECMEIRLLGESFGIRKHLVIEIWDSITSNIFCTVWLRIIKLDIAHTLGDREITSSEWNFRGYYRPLYDLEQNEVTHIDMPNLCTRQYEDSCLSELQSPFLMKWTIKYKKNHASSPSLYPFLPQQNKKKQEKFSEALSTNN